ncbi:hypothetical protein J6590_061047 [Homalodisca vitripennis]|nr:hypothetical protein J6590_061047 [Homalodisca vitripennis]
MNPVDVALTTSTLPVNTRAASPNRIYQLCPAAFAAVCQSRNPEPTSCSQRRGRSSVHAGTRTLDLTAIHLVSVALSATAAWERGVEPVTIFETFFPVISVSLIQRVSDTPVQSVPVQHETFYLMSNTRFHIFCFVKATLPSSLLRA